MATSGSVDYTTTRDELIKDALLLIGGIGEGVTPSSIQISDYSRVLNKMLKAWQVHGLHLWKVRQQSITPVLSDYQYTLGRDSAQVDMDRPLRIVDAYRRETSSLIDVPLTKMTREQYWLLSDKDNTGTPVNYYYDPQLDNGVLNIWPAPTSNFASNYTIEILYQAPIEDVDAATNNFDFPSEWLEAITYGLAIRIAPQHGLPMQERYALKKEAQEALDLVLEWDQEDGSILIQPNRRLGQ